MSEIKVAVFGAGAVGKSALTIQFVQGQFIKDYDPTIEDNYKLPYKVNDNNYQLDITDTAGQDDFAPMRTSYMRQGNGFILVYAIDDRSSFEEIEIFHKDLVRTKGTSDIPLVLCGHKCDLEDRREVTRAEGEILASKIKSKFFETSALANLNIDNAFIELIKEVNRINNLKEMKNKIEETPVIQNSGGCCQVI